MMLREKQGNLHYFVMSKDRKNYLSVPLSEFISKRQLSNVIGKPDLILNLAHQIRDHYQDEWNKPVSVYASSVVSLNGRPKIEMIEPGTDLAAQPRTLKSYQWIRPLNSERFLIGENK
jgi:hypothetical protein